MFENLNSVELVGCASIAVMILFAAAYFGARAVMGRRLPAGLDGTACALADRYRNGEITQDDAIARLASCYPGVSSTQLNAAFSRGLQVTR